MEFEFAENPTIRRYAPVTRPCPWRFPLLWFFRMKEQSLVLGFEQQDGGSNLFGLAILGGISSGLFEGQRVTTAREIGIVLFFSAERRLRYLSESLDQTQIHTSLRGTANQSVPVYGALPIF